MLSRFDTGRDGRTFRQMDKGTDWIVRASAARWRAIKQFIYEVINHHFYVFWNFYSLQVYENKRETYRLWQPIPRCTVAADVQKTNRRTAFWRVMHDPCAVAYSWIQLWIGLMWLRDRLLTRLFRKSLETNKKLSYRQRRHAIEALEARAPPPRQYFIVYVRPLLEYNSVVWSSCYNNNNNNNNAICIAQIRRKQQMGWMQDIEAIERVQRRFSKSKRLPGLKEFTYEERLIFLGGLPSNYVACILT